MRLKLVIIRHGLPATRILWTVAQGSQASHSIPSSTVASTRIPNVAYGDEGCTIAQLLDEINEVVPLETPDRSVGENDEIGGQWGLEDYVVEVNGFECLHFMHVDGLLRDGDEVVIRSLGLGDLRARRLSGRLQVSVDGRRLIDGVPFGRPYLQRSYSSRPPIRIPPRKRRRTTISTWAGNINNTEDDIDEFQRTASTSYDNRLALYDEASVQSSEQGTVIRHPVNPPDDFDDLEDSDMDYEEDEKEDLAEELKQLKEDAEDDAISNVTTETEHLRANRVSGRMSRIGIRDPLPTSSPARLSVTSTPRPNAARSAEGEASLKSIKSVHFEIDEKPFENGLSEDDSDSDEVSLSEKSSATGSSGSDSSDSSSIEDFSNDDSDNKSSDESSVSEESEPESDVEGATGHQESKIINVFTPPGQGSRKTRNSNRRKKLRIRLQKLKELGELPPEANFEHLEAWEAKHGKRPLTEVADLGDLRDSRVKEQTEIERKRQQLLRDLASGGIDVDGLSEKENIPPRYRNGKQDDGEVSEEVQGQGDADTKRTSTVVEPSSDIMHVDSKRSDEEKVTPNELKRRKLDVSSTKRLLFGSLGVRTPKSKEDEEALRTKLDGFRKKFPASTEVSQPVGAENEAEDLQIDENWQKKIILTATECVFDDIKLAAPTFPFQQRWDHDAGYAIRQRKGNSRKNKKRKEREWQEESYEDYQDTTWDDAEGGITLNYDDPPSTIQYEEQVGYWNGDAAEDLPTLPSDINTLPDLTENEVTTGAIIAFKQLDMSKATGWQPQVSDYKVAVVDKVLDNGDLDLVLAKRDRDNQQEAPVIDEDGFRRYSGFEMPVDDENGEAEDDGYRNLSFMDLLEPKLLRSTIQSHSDGQKARLSNGKHDGASILNHIPPVPASAGSYTASVDEADKLLAATAVCSQTRLEKSQMIRNAGYRSTVDSELEVSMLESSAKPNDVTTVDSSVIDAANETGCEAAESSDSISDISSSPPQAMLDNDDDDGDSADEEQHRAETATERDGPDDGNNMVSGVEESMMNVVDDDDESHMITESDFDAGSEDESMESDDSDDDRVSLPGDINEPARSNDVEIPVDDTMSSIAIAISDQARSPECCNFQPNTQEDLLYSSLLPQQELSRKADNGRNNISNEATEMKAVRAEKAENLPLSTAIRASTQRQDLLVNSAIEDQVGDNVSGNDSDAQSMVLNPFYERDTADAAARKSKEVSNGKGSLGGPCISSNLLKQDTSSFREARSHQKAEQPQRHTGDHEGDRQNLDLDTGLLDQEDEDDGASAYSDPELPSIEVLWASTAPTQKEFSPIKAEEGTTERRQSPTAVDDASSVQSSSPPAFEPGSTADDIPDTTKERPTREQHHLLTDNPASGESQDQENGEDRPASVSPSVPVLDSGPQQMTKDDHADDDNDGHDRYSADNENIEASNFAPVVDLTLSSPLVSPNDSSDEDFAKSQGLPRGSGWVKKNVPVTRRQTRSSTGGDNLLTSSPLPQRKRRITTRATQ